MAKDETGLQLPTHIGLILDGNRRWAKAKQIPLMEGHRAGYAQLKNIAEVAIDHGIPYVSAYIFSIQNWNRSKSEVKYLMELALWIAKNEVEEVHKKGIRVRFLGSDERVSPRLQRAITQAEEKTKDNKKGTLALCFNYTGQDEIARAATRVAAQGQKNITVEDITNNLDAPDIPPIDLLIRTSGELRLSDFMLWRAAYAELLFVDKYWPDFTEADLDAALEDYAQRQRRFGK